LTTKSTADTRETLTVDGVDSVVKMWSLERLTLTQVNLNLLTILQDVLINLN
jgi:hypothetical protein